MIKYKIERVEVKEEKNGKVETKVRHNIYKRFLFGWRFLTYKPSPSLARQALKDMGERECIYVDLT